MVGLHSFNTIEEAIKDGDFDQFFNNIVQPSDDTIDLRKFSSYIVQKARYNKYLNNNAIDGLR